jgi:hypothetical protein
VVFLPRAGDLRNSRQTTVMVEEEPALDLAA